MKEQRHKFTSYDGTALEGTLTSSSNAPNGVALLVHGITSSRDELGLYSGLAEHLSAVGIPSFRFDYRCHGTNKAPLESMTLAGIVNDIEAAAICASRVAAASSVHVVGMSFGGGLAAYWGSGTTLPLSSAALLAPVIDYEEDILGQYGLVVDHILAPRAQRQLRAKGSIESGGVPYGRALINELRHISGIQGLKRLQCRTLILHGDADSVVPFASSVRFAELNPRCRLINIRNTDHGFGVQGDEDLSWPATKAHHAEVFQLLSDFMSQKQ